MEIHFCYSVAFRVTCTRIKENPPGVRAKAISVRVARTASLAISNFPAMRAGCGDGTGCARGSCPAAAATGGCDPSIPRLLQHPRAAPGAHSQLSGPFREGIPGPYIPRSPGEHRSAAPAAHPPGSGSRESIPCCPGCSEKASPGRSGSVSPHSRGSAASCRESIPRCPGRSGSASPFHGSASFSPAEHPPSPGAHPPVPAQHPPSP